MRASAPELAEVPFLSTAQGNALLKKKYISEVVQPQRVGGRLVLLPSPTRHLLHLTVYSRLQGTHTAVTVSKILKSIQQRFNR